MAADDLAVNRTRLRGTDSNTLLRLYDRAGERRAASQTPGARAAADRAARLIADELRRRGVSYRPAVD